MSAESNVSGLEESGSIDTDRVVPFWAVLPHIIPYKRKTTI